MSTRDEETEALPGLAAVRARRRPAPARTTVELATDLPVARVLVDLPLAHLDRPFDYAVPASMADSVVAGARVKVRFAGQDVDGFVTERVSESDHPGRLQPIRRSISAEPVLSPEIASLTGLVARRYAGTRSDVLRLAVPPRHARAEGAAPPEPPAAVPDDRQPADGWTEIPHGEGFLAALHDGRAPRAVLSVPPCAQWPAMLADAAAATSASGRGVLLCVPDVKDVARLDRALTARLGSGHHVVLTADAGPERRYRDFLAVSRGQRRIVVGTRSAAFAPVADLGLVAIWDDGDDLYAEPRAPYPHTREVLLERADQTGAAALVAGFSRSVEAEYLLTTGWAHELALPRERLRERARVEVAGASDQALARDPRARSERIPRQVFEAIRAGLQQGPVLVQTPREGYASTLACERCRAPARCLTCQGPLRITEPTQPPACAWCGRLHEGWACRHCGHHGLRAPIRGDARTAEELGRMFPGVPVRTSSGDRVAIDVEAEPAIVVATPGAEPSVPGGYAAVILLDQWLMLARADLRTDEEALRRWLNAAGLVRAGGQVVAVGDAAHPAVQALVRWDPAGFARREMEERRSAHLPPASRLATIGGAPGAVDDAATLLSKPQGTELLGPVPITGRDGRDTDEVRLVVRAPRTAGAALSDALGELQRLRSARKLDAVRIQVDPVSLI